MGEGEKMGEGDHYTPPPITWEKSGYPKLNPLINRICPKANQKEMALQPQKINLRQYEPLNTR